MQLSKSLHFCFNSSETHYPVFIVHNASIDPGWVQPCPIWSPLEEIRWDLRRSWPSAAAPLLAAHQRLLFWELLRAKARGSGCQQTRPSRPWPQAPCALSAPISTHSLPPNQTREGAGSPERRGRLLDKDAPVPCSEDVQSLLGSLSVRLYGVGRLEFLPSVAVYFRQCTHTFAPAVVGGSQIVLSDSSGYSWHGSEAGEASPGL